MATLAQTPAIPIGVIKQFGPWGPEYEVLGEAEPENGIRQVRIVLVCTGEENHLRLRRHDRRSRGR